MIEQTLVLIKPDGVMKGCVDKIRQRYLDWGLELVKEKEFYMSQDDVASFYEEHKGQPFFEGLILAMSSGLMVAFVFKGDNAVREVRNLNGDTDPKKAESGTIRHDFMSAGGPFNTVHGSASVDDAHREILLIFPK